MEFSKGYFSECYEKALREGLKAKDGGNPFLAKKKFAEASDFLTKLAYLCEGDEKAERLARAEKLKRISDGIKADVKTQKGKGVFPQKSESAGSFQNTGGFTGISTPTDVAEFTANEDVLRFVTVIMPEELTFGFEGVMGLEEAKETIREYVVNPIKYPEAYNYDFMDNKAILLFGPPGTGKTTFAKAVAREIGQPFFLVNMSELVNAYIGETAKNIDKAFEYMRSYVENTGQDIVVFFDEFDEISKKRGGDDKASETAVPALLRNLDGIKRNKGFTVLANTNCKDLLDDAVLSRFRRRIMIPLPDKETRKKLFENSLKDLEKEYLDKIDLDSVALSADGLSGRDIAYLCDDFKRTVAKYKAGLMQEKDWNETLLSATRARSTKKE